PRTCPHPMLRHGAHTVEMPRALKALLFTRMYRHFRVVRMAKRAEQFIRGIFKSYLEEPRQLPDEYRTQQGAISRVVADYVASMTDRSALLEYRRLFDPLMLP